MLPTPPCGLYQEDWTPSEFFLDSLYLQFCLESTYQDFFFVSRFDPTKFVPLYEQITVGLYLFVINLRRHMIKELVDKEGTTPTDTPVVRTQVKTQPYFFSFQSCFTLKGSKKSTRSLENGVATCKWSTGLPAIKGGSGVSLFENNILTKFAPRVTKKPTSK